MTATQLNTIQLKYSIGYSPDARKDQDEKNVCIIVKQLLLYLGWCVLVHFDHCGLTKASGLASLCAET